MDSTRQKKFARAIQKELSTLLQRELDGFQGTLITVGFVSVTADLSIARVYVTCYPDSRLAELLNFLNEEQKKIRFLLAGRIKDVTRQIPTLQFYEDDTLKTASQLDALFEKIHAQQAARPQPSDQSNGS